MTTPPSVADATGLQPLWLEPPEFLPTEPSPVAPSVWSYTDVLRPRCLRAVEDTSTDEAERRVILLCPEALGQPHRTTPGLIAGLQVLAPGESARVHRHTPAALRFHLEGDGAVTVVDGERLAMHPYDLVLTPAMSWHEHESPDAQAPVIWLDGVDLPIVRGLDAVFFEPEPADRGVIGGAERPRMRFPWADQRRKLDTAAAGGDAPLTTLAYLTDAGTPITATIGAWAHRLAAGASTVVPRTTSSAVSVLVSGELHVRSGGANHRLSRHDVLVVQPWTEMTWSAGDEPAYLFSFGDEPALRSLGLLRTEGDEVR